MNRGITFGSGVGQSALIGQQEEHLTCKMPVAINPKGYLLGHWSNTRKKSS